jgi:predicted enzyme related to lactoylglutathione lyase
MTDPLDALRSPAASVPPDPDFAAQLRERILRALLAAPAAAPTQTATTQTATTQEEAMTDVLLRDGLSRNGTRAGDVSYVWLALPDLARGRAFYGIVLGWTFGAGQVDPGANQVDDVIPQVGLSGARQPSGRERHGAVLCYRVDDLAAAVAAVREHGGSAGEPHQEPYGLVADCVDDQGVELYLHELPPAGRRAPDTGVLAGDVSYISLLVPDAEAARGFYGAVLGWRFAQGSTQGTAPMVGIGGGRVGEPGVVLCFRVDDIAAAVARIRDAGGTATDPVERPYALEADCTDDQGTPFYLHQFPG